MQDPLRVPPQSPVSFYPLPTLPIKIPTPRKGTSIDDSGVFYSPTCTDSSISSYAPTVRPAPSPPRPPPHIRPHTTSTGADIEWFCCFCSAANSIASFAAAIASSGSSPAALPNCSFCGLGGCIDCNIHAATLSQRDVPIVPTAVAGRFRIGAGGSGRAWNFMAGISDEEMEIAQRKEMVKRADEELRRQIERGEEEWERETRRREEWERTVDRGRMRSERELDELKRKQSRFEWEEGRRGGLVPQESWEGGEVYEGYEEEARWAEGHRAQHGVEGAGESVGSGTSGEAVQEDEYKCPGSWYGPRYQSRY